MSLEEIKKMGKQTNEWNGKSLICIDPGGLEKVRVNS